VHGAVHRERRRAPAIALEIEISLFEWAAEMPGRDPRKPSVSLRYKIS
jgi:hypothetical protein